MRIIKKRHKKGKEKKISILRKKAKREETKTRRREQRKN